MRSNLHKTFRSPFCTIFPRPKASLNLLAALHSVEKRNSERNVSASNMHDNNFTRRTKGSVHTAIQFTGSSYIQTISGRAKPVTRRGASMREDKKGIATRFFLLEIKQGNCVSLFSLAFFLCSTHSSLAILDIEKCSTPAPGGKIRFPPPHMWIRFEFTHVESMCIKKWSDDESIMSESSSSPRVALESTGTLNLLEHSRRSFHYCCVNINSATLISLMKTRRRRKFGKVLRDETRLLKWARGESIGETLFVRCQPDGLDLCVGFDEGFLMSLVGGEDEFCAAQLCRSRSKGSDGLHHRMIWFCVGRAARSSRSTRCDVWLGSCLWLLEKVKLIEFSVEESKLFCIPQRTQFHFCFCPPCWFTLISDSVIAHLFNIDSRQPPSIILTR
jgi:hypothetical protein